LHPDIPALPKLPFGWGRRVYLACGPAENVGIVTGYTLRPGTVLQVAVRWSATAAEDLHYPFELVTNPELCPSPGPGPGTEWAN